MATIDKRFESADNNCVAFAEERDADRIRCPQCSGKKLIGVRVQEFGKPATHVALKCPTCNALGWVTPQRRAEWQAEQDSWCRCESVADDAVSFYDDGQHSGCSKHHYRHEPGCGKIVQIG